MTHRAIETEIKTIYPVDIGDFVTIPAWRITGRVVDLAPAYYGAEGSFRVMLQEHPEQAHGCWYMLEPGNAWSVGETRGCDL